MVASDGTHSLADDVGMLVTACRPSHMLRCEGALLMICDPRFADGSLNHG